MRRFEKDKPELETIRIQPETARWPDFGEVAPAR